MKQVWISRAGGPEVLEVRSAPDPAPGPGEVLVQVRAAGVAFADLMARAGKYGDAPPLPCVVGYEIAGEVVAVGEPVPSGGARPPDTQNPGAGGDGTGPNGAEFALAELGSGPPHFTPGDRVFGLTKFGGYSSMIALPAAQLFRMPADMSFPEAASISVNYITAYLALIRVCNVQRGENVLIHNIGGGVGVAALQLAKRAGARVYGTASGWKHETLRALGADELIDYTTVDWVAAVNELTGGPGMHAVLDPVGGRNLTRDFEVMAPLARLAAYGFSEPVRAGDRPFLATLKSVLGMPRPHMIKLISNNWFVGGLNLAHLWTELDRLRPIAEDVLAAWEQGYVRPVIAGEFTFEDAGDAHRMLIERRNLGKAVLTP